MFCHSELEMFTGGLFNHFMCFHILNPLLNASIIVSLLNILHVKMVSSFYSEKVMVQVFISLAGETAV